VEAAFWSLAAAVDGRALCDVLGGSREEIAVGESLGISETIDGTLKEVEERLAEGYQRIKLKICPGWDIAVVAAVRDAFGPELMLQVDANASYTLQDADRLAGLDQFRLACIEQPLEWDGLLEHAELQRRLRTPICLDETLRSVADVRRALDLGACRNVNLKPARVGGLTAALQIAELCRSRGVPLWCGGMLESGIGRAGNLALASLDAFTEPADMSPASMHFAWDLVDPTFEVNSDGTITVPRDAGLGFPVRTDRVDEHAVRRITVEPADQSSG
jgi:O-succinylbenzoate synthase